MRYLGLGLAVALLAAAWCGVWFYLAGQAPVWIDDWAQGEREKGAQVTWSALHVEGFPFRLKIVVEDPHIARAEGAWTGKRLVGYAQPWDLNHWILRFEGPQAVADQGRRLDIDGDSLMASARFAEGRLVRADVDLYAVTLRPSWLPGPISADRIQLHGMGAENQQTALAFSAKALNLPAGLVQGLPERIESAELVGTLEGRTIRAPTRPELAAWSRSGGVVQVSRAALKAGSLDVVADGTFALDDGLRPQGAGVVAATGLDSVIDALVSLGRLGQGAGETAKGALAVASLAARDDAGRTKIPFAIQDGTLSIGPAPIAKVQPVL